MSAIQDIFRTYGPEYPALYQDRMPQNHKKVMKAIGECRSGFFGTILYDCENCHSIHPVPCCCGNRHCLVCQHDKADKWLRKQMEKLLPTHYFLLTITLPESLRVVVRSNQKAAYAALFSCAHESLKKLAKDKRFIGSSRIGYLAVLHTWGGKSSLSPPSASGHPRWRSIGKGRAVASFTTRSFCPYKTSGRLIQGQIQGCHESSPPYGSNTCFIMGAGLGN